MCIDTNKNPVLYSVCTLLAYKISQEYYNNVHYVWCTTCFDCLSQPPTSNPQTIVIRYLEQVVKGDRHSKEIEDNMAGIIAGAKCKLKEKVITKKQYDEIRSLVAVARYESFFPVIYIINSDKVKNKCIEVDQYECASDTSEEYRIEELKADEFQIINMKDVLFGIVNAIDKKAGE